MKQVLFYIVLFLVVISTNPAFAQTATIPDPNFLSFLKDTYSSTINNKNQLIISEAAKVDGIFDCSNQDIANLEGIQYFTNITTLDADDNELADVSQIVSLKSLQSLRLENNFLTSLPDLSKLVNLKILIAYDNKLQMLPDLSANVQLTQLVVYNNQLKVLPDLRSLVNLQKLDAGNNQLNFTPDLSTNIALATLSLDKNFLTSGPDLSKLKNLTIVELNSNYLSFEDLLPYTSYNGFSSKFVVAPQKEFPRSNMSVLENTPLKLTTGIDSAIDNVTYSWYYSSKLLKAVPDDSLIINPANYSHEGKYYCILSHPSIPGLQLKTSEIQVDVITCPAIGDFTFEFGSVNCYQAGTLKINLTSMPTQVYTFYLKSPVTGDTIISQTGFFKGLNQPEYILSVKSGAACQVTLPDPVSIPYEECKEVYITPDGDGEKDSHFFSQDGTAVIYDRNGKPVMTLALPGEWNGSSGSGALVAPGYYSADINRGEKFVNISVLY